MIYCLTRITTRFKVTFLCCQQWLPPFASLSLLSALILSGGEIFPPELQLPSLTIPSYSVSTAANHQGLETGINHQPPTQQLARSTKQRLKHLLSSGNPLLSPSSPSLPIALPTHLPENLAGLGGEERKKLFIGLLLPTVMVALDEVKQERQQLLSILAELGASSTDFTFAKNNPQWQQQVGIDKTTFILGLTRKYRTESATELLGMVNVLPPSLIIAQGALESAWGASRSAVKGNNLFGMYANVSSTLPNAQNGDRELKIMEYESILDSVRSYILNINRLAAYKELRRLRTKTLDPMRIAEGLTEYSERKEHYIADVKQIIAYNNLRNFDTLILFAA